MSWTSDAAAKQASLAEFGVPKERMAGLFDGIVAITATLLVLNINIPPANGVLSALDFLAIARLVLHWAVSFVMVAVIWTEFHVVFAHSKRWDGGLLLMTFLQMALISLIPFAADLAASFPHSLPASLVFTAVMGANCLLISANIYTLQRKSHLHAMAHSHGQLARRRRAQTLIYPLTILASLLAAIVHDPFLGVLAWALCPLALAWHLQRPAKPDDDFPLNDEAAA